MTTHTITYAALKVVSSAAYILYYNKKGTGYEVVVAVTNLDKELRCSIIKKEDIADFEATLLASAKKVRNVDDAAILLMLGLKPPLPI